MGPQPGTARSPSPSSNVHAGGFEPALAQMGIVHLGSGFSFARGNAYSGDCESRSSVPGSPPTGAPGGGVHVPSNVTTGSGASKTGDHRAVDPDPERQRILDALEKCAGNQTRAARLLGISRNTLLARLDAYGINRPR